MKKKKDSRRPNRIVSLIGSAFGYGIVCGRIGTDLLYTWPTMVALLGALWFTVNFYLEYRYFKNEKAKNLPHIVICDTCKKWRELPIDGKSGTQ